MEIKNELVSVKDAIKRSDLSALKQLVTRKNALGLTTTNFDLCCRIGNIDCIKWFIDDLGVTNLFAGCLTACSYRNMNAIQFFLQTYPHIILEKGTCNDTLLHFAWRFDYNVVKILLDNKANVHVKNDNRNTPIAELLIHYDCDDEDVGGFHRIVCLMMEYGARLPENIDVPINLESYQIKLDRKRSRCKSAGIALLIALREKGVPNDLARYIITRFVLSSWIGATWLVKHA